MASTFHDPGEQRAAMRVSSSTAKKLWAIACVVGFTAFWIYGFIALSGAFGDRPSHALNYVLCLAGLGVGIIGWFRVMSYAPPMHRRRAAARARLEEEFRRSQEAQD